MVACSCVGEGGGVKGPDLRGGTRGLVVSLCDRSGVMLRPWAEAGYRCIAVDIEQPEPGARNGIEFLRADVFDLADDFAVHAWAAFAFPPCDDLAVSGARWWAGKGQQRFAEAVALADRCRFLVSAGTGRWAVENPAGRLSQAWGKARFSFHPNEYARWADVPADEQYRKRTMLWAGLKFVMPAKHPLPPVLGSKIHRIPPGPNRKYMRSLTPSGFARAVFYANAQEPASYAPWLLV
jgi:hypothetical protein